MAKSNRSDIDEADASLFREAVGAVKRLPPVQEPPSAPPPPPIPMQRIRDDKAVMDALMDIDPDVPMADTGEGLWHAKPGVQERVLRKLRRGHFSVQAQLDLHGMTSAMAKLAVDEFIAHCRGSTLLCVRIIHGKGLRSKAAGPILKNKLNIWLRRRDDILAFCSARQVDGGTGAIYALIRATR